jgi:hypothetical protein
MFDSMVLKGGYHFSKKFQIQILPKTIEQSVGIGYDGACTKDGVESDASSGWLLRWSSTDIPPRILPTAWMHCIVCYF